MLTRADSTVYHVYYKDYDDKDVEIDITDTNATSYDGTNEYNNQTVAPTAFTSETGKVYLYNLNRFGYTFEGWCYNTFSEITSFDVAPSGTKYYYINSSVAKNIIVFPMFEPVSYNIFYNNTDDSTNENPLTYTLEDEITLSAPIKQGYDFVGWYRDSEFTQRINTIEKGTTGDISLYAKFVIKDCVITFKYGDYDDINLKFGDEITENMLPTPERKGYTFEGWYTTNGFVTKVDAGFVVNRDISLYARWTKIENPMWKWFTFGGMGIVVILTCVWFIVFNRTKGELE